MEISLINVKWKYTNFQPPNKNADKNDRYKITKMKNLKQIKIIPAKKSNEEKPRKFMADSRGWVIYITTLLLFIIIILRFNEIK